jgi:hypothetical protein
MPTDPAIDAPPSGGLRGPQFWLRWVIANAFAELLGLGVVAAAGYLVVSRFGEPASPLAAVATAAVFVGLGGFEGLVLGVAQHRVLQRALPALTGWVRATVVGALAAWLLGMLPSTIISLLPGEAGPTPPEIDDTVQLLAAAGLGIVAGPALAFFQWRRLRVAVPARAWSWLPANAVAWALGMPVVFLAADLASRQSGVLPIATTVACALFAAGAIVGAVHGAFLAWAILPMARGRLAP